MPWITEYKTGALVSGRGCNAAKPSMNRRGTVLSSQSDKSRRRAAFAFSNAEVTWGYMMTCTYEEGTIFGADVAKAHLRSMRELFRRLGAPVGWIMEFTQKGTPHFHLFIPDSLKVNVGEQKSVGRPHVVIDDRSCAWAKSAVDLWISVTECQNPAFHLGGIIEIISSADGAGRYVAKEACKRAQKVAPEWFSWSGRFWGMPRAYKPRPRKVVEIWPEDVPEYSIIFDKTEVKTKEKTTKLKYEIRRN